MVVIVIIRRCGRVLLRRRKRRMVLILLLVLQLIPLLQMVRFLILPLRYLGLIGFYFFHSMMMIDNDANVSFL
jgi:hypothetical protein